MTSAAVPGLRELTEIRLLLARGPCPFVTGLGAIEAVKFCEAGKELLAGVDALTAYHGGELGRSLLDWLTPALTEEGPGGELAISGRVKKTDLAVHVVQAADGSRRSIVTVRLEVGT